MKEEKGIRMLMVEACTEIEGFLKAYLANWEIVYFNNADDAAELLKTDLEFDVIVSNFVSGNNAARLQNFLKHFEIGTNIPFVVCSGIVENVLGDFPYDGFICKPFDPEEFKKEILRVVDSA